MKESKLHRVTSGMFNDNSPAWHPGGDYLYFMSRHEFQPQLSQIEFDFATNRASGIFVMALRKDVKNPFPPESDEVTIKEASAKDSAKDTGKDKDKGKDEKDAKDKKAEESHAEPKDGGIDFDGLEQRVARVPLDADNYYGLTVTNDALIYAVAPEPYYGRSAATKTSLRIFTFKDRKETQPGRRYRRICSLARWIESAGPAGAGLERVRRHGLRRAAPRKPSPPAA